MIWVFLPALFALVVISWIDAGNQLRHVQQRLDALLDALGYDYDPETQVLTRRPAPPQPAPSEWEM